MNTTITIVVAASSCVAVLHSTPWHQRWRTGKVAGFSLDFQSKSTRPNRKMVNIERELQRLIHEYNIQSLRQRSRSTGTRALSREASSSARTAPTRATAHAAMRPERPSPAENKVLAAFCAVLFGGIIVLPIRFPFAVLYKLPGSADRKVGFLRQYPNP